MHLLGRNLADHKPVRIALQGFFGVGSSVASRILARLQIHHHCRVEQLTEPQITALSSFLSSTATAAKAIATPVSNPPLPPKCLDYQPPQRAERTKPVDPLDALRIETDLKKAMSADILHLREIGTYRGKSWSAGSWTADEDEREDSATAQLEEKVLHYGGAGFVDIWLSPDTELPTFRFFQRSRSITITPIRLVDA